MATLYFSNTSTDWSNPASWFTTLSSSGVFSGAAGRIPNSSDTAIICGTISNISGAFTAPAVLQLGTLTPYLYSGFWNGDGFNFLFPKDFNLPLVNLISIHNVNTSVFWAAGLHANYSITTLNLFGDSIFESNATIGTANFYDYSKNGGPDESGYIYGNANFYNNSTNLFDGNNEGYIIGNAVFNDSSSNAGSGNIGHVTGTATFNGNSSNANSGHIGAVNGTATFTSTASVQNTLAGVFVDAAVFVNIPSGGISKANVLLTQLLKLPFPIIV